MQPVPPRQSLEHAARPWPPPRRLGDGGLRRSQYCLPRLPGRRSRRQTHAPASAPLHAPGLVRRPRIPPRPSVSRAVRVVDALWWRRRLLARPAAVLARSRVDTPAPLLVRPRRPLCGCALGGRLPLRPAPVGGVCRRGGVARACVANLGEPRCGLLRMPPTLAPGQLRVVLVHCCLPSAVTRTSLQPYSESLRRMGLALTSVQYATLYLARITASKRIEQRRDFVALRAGTSGLHRQVSQTGSDPDSAGLLKFFATSTSSGSAGRGPRARAAAVRVKLTAARTSSALIMLRYVYSV